MRRARRRPAAGLAGRGVLAGVAPADFRLPPGEAAAFFRPSDDHRMGQELRAFWDSLPHKGVFALLFGAWLALFHFIGHAQLGWLSNPSLFLFLDTMYSHAADVESDDAIGRYIPVVFLVLLLVQRGPLTAVRKEPWAGGLVLVLLGCLMHVFAYTVQMFPFSLLAFLTGLYGLTGLVWGPAWLRAAFFPFVVLVFCLPVEPYIEGFTFKLRHLAAAASTWVCTDLLGLKLVRQELQVICLGPKGEPRFQFEVAAACSGIRSLKVILLLTLIYGFLTFRTLWRRLLVLAVAPLLAVSGNIGRLIVTFTIGEAHGESVAKKIETNAGYFTFLIALGGVLLLGRLLREKDPAEPAGPAPRPPADPTAPPAAPQMA